MARPTEALLDLEALRHNAALARELAPHSKMMAVVKANAYGHGAETIAAALESRVDAFAVACIEEAVALRDSGITAPILLLQGIFAAAELAVAEALDFWLMIDDVQQLEWMEQARLHSPRPCWLKIDTGMHRLGAQPEQAADFLRRLEACAAVAKGTVLCTHFASADELDNSQTERQLALFEQTCRPLPGPRSAANSPGLLGWPASHYDWIRPGYMLYGNSPFPGPQIHADRLRPVMTLQSRISSLREVATGETVGYGANWTARRQSRIATVSAGYGDGYPRLAENGTPVLIDGQRAPLAGRVSMDMLTVDVTDLPAASLDSTVTLWGQGLPVGEVAAHAGTIGYELTTRMPLRAPRRVIKS